MNKSLLPCLNYKNCRFSIVNIRKKYPQTHIANYPPCRVDTLRGRRLHFLELKSSEILLRLKTDILPTQTVEKLLFW